MEVEVVVIIVVGEGEEEVLSGVETEEVLGLVDVDAGSGVLEVMDEELVLGGTELLVDVLLVVGSGVEELELGITSDEVELGTDEEVELGTDELDEEITLDELELVVLLTTELLEDPPTGARLLYIESRDEPPHYSCQD